MLLRACAGVAGTTFVTPLPEYLRPLSPLIMQTFGQQRVFGGNGHSRHDGLLMVGFAEVTRTNEHLLFMLHTCCSAVSCCICDSYCLHVRGSCACCLPCCSTRGAQSANINAQRRPVEGGWLRQAHCAGSRLRCQLTGLSFNKSVVS
jgi:hypothetical protein